MYLEIPPATSHINQEAHAPWEFRPNSPLEGFAKLITACNGSRQLCLEPVTEVKQRPEQDDDSLFSGMYVHFEGQRRKAP